MWTIRQPKIPAEEAFRTCVTGMRDATTRERFAAVEDAVIDADVKFQEKAETGDCEDLEASDFALPSVDMPWLYRERLVKAVEGRRLYDCLKKLAPGKKCPLCGHGVVKTLDHHLAKHRYHALAVNPLNLVPACRDCNTEKLDCDDDTLNPYFDDVRDQWLYARLIQGPPGEPPTVEFFVDFPDNWPDRLRKRVENHFRVFQLAERFEVAAGSELTSIVYTLRRIWDEERADGVRRHLLDLARGARLMAANTWQAALFDGLAASHWYCDGGFRTGLPDFLEEEDAESRGA